MNTNNLNSNKDQIKREIIINRIKITDMGSRALDAIIKKNVEAQTILKACAFGIAKSETIKEIIENLKHSGMKYSQISQITRLSLDEIENL